MKYGQQGILLLSMRDLHPSQQSNILKCCGYHCSTRLPVFLIHNGPCIYYWLLSGVMFNNWNSIIHILQDTFGSPNAGNSSDHCKGDKIYSIAVYDLICICEQSESLEYMQRSQLRRNFSVAIFILLLSVNLLATEFTETEICFAGNSISQQIIKT